MRRWLLISSATCAGTLATAAVVGTVRAYLDGLAFERAMRSTWPGKP